VSKDNTKWTHSGNQWLDYLCCHIVISAHSSTSRSNVTMVARPVHLRYDKNDSNDSIWTEWDKKGKKNTKPKGKEVQSSTDSSSKHRSKPRNPHERLPNVNHLAYRVAHTVNALPAKISDQAKIKNDANRVAVSHLCDTLGCIRPKHIDSSIDWNINTSRKSCEGWSLLVRAGVIVQETPCNHNLPCVKIRVVYISDETLKHLQNVSLMVDNDDEYDE